MISPAFIAHWRSGAPWATDPQVEHDLILLKAKIIRPAFRNDSLPLLPPNAAYAPDVCDSLGDRTAVEE